MTPTASVSASPIPTVALDLEGTSVVWATYHSDALGISFEYPRSSTSQSTLPQCAPRELDQTIVLDRLEIVGDAEKRLPAGVPVTADAVADNFVQGSTADTRGPKTVGGQPGVMVGYRFGGLNRFGEAVFVAHGGHVYGFVWTAGVFDCTPAPGFTGPSVYGHLIESVRFLA